MRFAALQSRVGDLLLRRMSNELRSEVVGTSRDGEGGMGTGYRSIAVCGRDGTYVRSSAVYRILQSLDGRSKRLRLIQCLSLVGYVVPTRVRDWAYRMISNRRMAWFGASDVCLLWDDRFDDRFVDDGVLTGTYRVPFADPHAEVVTADVDPFRGENSPVRGDAVRIIWPPSTSTSASTRGDAIGANDDGPSVSYDDEFPDGICLVGGTGRISTVDLPMRVVLRVDRESIGLAPGDDGESTMFAWVKPREIAML
jgi:predicted DCC family thiol-disulfide oxidoreductase YuxK